MFRLDKWLQITIEEIHQNVLKENAVRNSKASVSGDDAYHIRRLIENELSKSVYKEATKSIGKYSLQKLLDAKCKEVVGSETNLQTRSKRNSYCFYS